MIGIGKFIKIKLYPYNLSICIKSLTLLGEYLYQNTRVSPA